MLLAGAVDGWSHIRLPHCYRAGSRVLVDAILLRAATRAKLLQSILATRSFTQVYLQSAHLLRLEQVLKSLNLY